MKLVKKGPLEIREESCFLHWFYMCRYVPSCSFYRSHYWLNIHAGASSH